jgi:hypothetical protein
MKEFPKGENGQVLILVTIFLLVLVCFVAMAVDVGMMFRQKRKMQIAADAGAVAGALASRWTTSSVTTAAQNAALANGVTNASYVTVDTSPTVGYHTGAGFVRVTISQPTSTFFMRVANITNINVGAVSVAGTVPNDACMIALDPGQDTTFNVQGSAVVNAPNCAIHINSSSQQALCSTGNASITSPFIGIDGYQNTQGNCNGTQQNVSSDNGIMKDPYSSLPWLDSTCNAANGVSNSYTFGGTEVTTALQASVNALGTTTAATGTTNVICFSSAVTIDAGVQLGPNPTWDAAANSYDGGNTIFVFQRGVTFAGTAGSMNTVSGTLDLQGGSYSFGNGNSYVKMYGPASTSTGYAYNSLAFIVDPLNTSVSCSSSVKPITLTSGSNACLQVQFGSGSGDLDGVIYAPNATVYMQDNGGSTTVAGIVSGAIYDKSSTLSIPMNYNIAHASTTPMSTTAMVE